MSGVLLSQSGILHDMGFVLLYTVPFNFLVGSVPVVETGAHLVR